MTNETTPKEILNALNDANIQKASSSSYGSVSVASTATSIRSSESTRTGIIIVNNSSQTVYLGLTDAVTTSNGIPVEASENFYTSDWTGDIYGIVASGTANVRLFAFY